MHAWDLAKATGQSTDLDPELAAFSLDAAMQRMGPGFRGEGRPFGEEQPCPNGRCEADQLAAFLGRAVNRQLRSAVGLAMRAQARHPGSSTRSSQVPDGHALPAPGQVRVATARTCPQ
jgi:hypothetical protein